MNLMQMLFSNQLDDFVIVFLDDILIFSKNKQDHLRHVQQVLDILKKNKLYAKMSKCEFMQSRVSFLGHEVSGQGISMEASKVKAINEWPRPSDISDIRAFLGLSGYYRKFVRGFSRIASPLRELLKNDAVFQWSQ